MHVGDLDGSPGPAPRNRWNAKVVIVVHDAFENPVASATIDGSWSAGASGGGSCFTDAEGQCDFTKNNIKGNVTSAIFTIDTITHPTLNYKPADNHDSEPDSDGTFIEVFKDGQSQNQPPQASFTSSCSGQTCDFDAAGSSDNDGIIETLDWDFGDGNIGSGWNPSHTFGTEDTFQVTLTVTDDGGASDSTSQDVTPGSPVGQEMHVADLAGGFTTGRKNRWNPTVTIGIHNIDHNLIGGANVTGIWDTGREMSCTTSPGGYCSLTLPNIKTSDPLVTFTVTDITAPGWQYVSSKNHDINGGNDGTTITVSYQ
jgi:hypothetical protein